MPRPLATVLRPWAWFSVGVHHPEVETPGNQAICAWPEFNIILHVVTWPAPTDQALLADSAERLQRLSPIDVPPIPVQKGEWPPHLAIVHPDVDLPVTESLNNPSESESWPHRCNLLIMVVPEAIKTGAGVYTCPILWNNGDGKDFQNILGAGYGDV